uniref:ABC transporter domain-containing protein n=1 Tax=Panthera leo TaxID=9689 RepID=A0A8C8YCH4_PANLE
MPDSCPVCFPAGADPSPSGGKVTMVRNLKLLLWKNFILKKRKTLITVLEILMPLLFSMIIMYLRLNSLPKKIPPVNYPAINISLLPAFLYFPTYTRYQLVYVSSKSETLKTITEAVGKSFDVERGIHKMRILGHSSVPLFENYILQDPKAVFVLAGIVFDHTFNDSKQPLPLKVKYRLRFSYTQRNFLIAQLTSKQDYVDSWGTSFLYPPNPSQEPRALGHSDGGLPGYSNEGFLAIQHALDKAIMHYHAHNGTTEMFEGLSVLVKRFPHGAHVQDGLLVTLQNEFPLLLMLSFICIELIIINSVALEKEKKLKEYMCMMGVDNWQHWAAWFIVFFVSALLAVSFMTVLFCTQVRVRVAVFRNSDPSLIFVFLLSFAMATVFFAFMISTFFQKAHVATASGGIIFFLTYLPYLYLTFSYSQRTHFQKIGFCLLSNVAMALGVRFISIFEIRGTGLQWKNVGGFSGELNFCQVLLMLLLDSVLYGAVAGYVEAVLPGEHGVPKPWYFFVMPSHWRGQPVPLTRSVLHVADPDNSPKSQLIQEEPTSLKKGIEIQHLYKVSNKHVAVKDLTLNLYQGQITALLGHNGAGKTTTCYVLTGLIPPSSGCVYINGYEISHNMAEIRKSMGWCPQHDILFDDLTVAEHLSFYAQLKGLSRLKCPEEVQRMLHALSLEDKRDSLSRCLSGGLRRKLSIGIALIAGSKVLMLDEPTSGMDAVSRRAIWDLLQQHKSQRTVLLTTHFMDEADLLGDRVAIMAKGELQCCGSSLFLKQKYGAGYYMTLVKKPHCSTEKIAHLIYHHIPNAVLQSSIGEELTFILPKKSMPRFASLFTELEQRQVELGIASFGASVTTMEEVFIRSPKGHYLVTNLLFGIAFLSSSFAILTVKERSTKAKHIQFVSGVYVATFWLSALLWDLITSLVPTLLLLVRAAWFRDPPPHIPAIILVLMLYSWASIPLVYLSSFCFRKEGSAFVKLLVMLTFLSHTRVSESLDHAFLMLPGHCLGMALFNLHYNHGLQKLCKTRNLSQSECNKFCEYQRYMVQESVYAWESLGMGKYLAALAVLGSVYLILLFLIETNVLRELKARFSDLNGNRDLPQNGDDKHRGDSGLLIPGLLTERLLSWAHQVYGRKVPLLAVNKVSFAVQAEECFGLLGVNGAGKTSIFKMLTGEEPITSGDAFIKGLSISSHLRKVRQWVGYCPQSDTLLNHMTGWETLVMYARIRGIPERHIGTCVEQILEELLMYTYTDKLVKTYRHLNCSRFADKPQSSAATHTQQLAWLSSPSRATPALTGTRRLLRAGSVLEDEHQGMVHYHLPGEDLSWAKVFDILEQAKRKFMLDDYSVNQVSLEDIFLSFTYPISVRGRGLGVALDQIGTSHLGGLVDSPGASPWEKIPLSPT